MTTIAKIKAGYKAKASGHAFENMIISKAPKQGFKCIQIPSGCRQAGKILIRVKTPFDFVLVKDNMVLFIDAKSTSAKNFTASQITPHQAKHLLDIQKKGHPAGYLVHFQGTGEIYFYSAMLLDSMLKGRVLGQPTLIGTISDFYFEKCSIV